MPRLTPEVRDARRQQIGEATLRCLGRRGLANTSMADIIKESGLSAGSIYSHFDSKAALVKYAAATMVEVRGAKLRDPSGQGFTPRQVTRLMVTEVLPEELRGALLQIWAEASSDDDLHPVVAEQLGMVRSLLVEALTPWARSQRTDETGATALADARADLVMALMQGYLVRVSLQRDVDRDALLENVLATVEG